MIRRKEDAMSNAPVAQSEIVHSQHGRALVEVHPHRWALNSWARVFRRLARRWTVHGHVRKFCRPFMLEGEENFAGIASPLLIIANHASHFDTVIVLSVLPDRIY